MAIREIVTSNDPFIRKKSRKVDDFDENLAELLDDMADTLNEKEGVGLAAVQVGVLKSVFIININNCFMEFVNPEILSKKGSQTNKEGCLSVLEPYDYVNRPKDITIKAFDRFGNKFTFSCTDWTAICIMHEYDHLDGILYIDHVIKK